MKPTKAIFVLHLFLLIALAAGAPDEVMGSVTKVIDGDTFDVQLQDSSLSEDLIRVRLADIDVARKPEAPKPAKLERMHPPIPDPGC